MVLLDLVRIFLMFFPTVLFLLLGVGGWLEVVAACMHACVRTVEAAFVRRQGACGLVLRVDLVD